jgi:hypothetical protein
MLGRTACCGLPGVNLPRNEAIVRVNKMKSATWRAGQVAEIAIRML